MKCFYMPLDFPARNFQEKKLLPTRREPLIPQPKKCMSNASPQWGKTFRQKKNALFAGAGRHIKKLSGCETITNY